MSASKSERLLNLLIMLLSTRGWVGRDRIRQVIEGYHGLDDRNFERTFERDKAELRSIGVPVEAGSHDPEGGEPGYRVDRSAFELPPISFTTDELAALGAAARVWQDSVAADDTRVALATLRAAGADPDAARLLTLQPQLTAIDGLDVWWEALRDRREVRFGYRDEPRRLQPWRIVQRRGHWYVIGLDLDRAERRHFKLSRLTAPPRAVGESAAYEPPETVVIDFTSSEQRPSARVALRPGRGHDLVRNGRLAAPMAGDPEGFEVYELPLTPVLVGEICALGADAIALAPEELVDDVVARLRAVAGRWAR